MAAPPPLCIELRSVCGSAEMNALAVGRHARVYFSGYVRQVASALLSRVTIGYCCLRLQIRRRHMVYACDARVCAALSSRSARQRAMRFSHADAIYS